MWKPDSKVKYISHSGRESTRTICVTAEGFASIMENGEELLFSGNGKPVNATFSPDTGGPSIKLVKEAEHQQQSPIKRKSNNNKNKRQEPNYKNATFEQPWDNVFALKNLTVDDLHDLTKELIKLGHGDQKLHLKNFGESANIDDKKKIRRIFLDAKERSKKEN